MCRDDLCRGDLCRGGLCRGGLCRACAGVTCTGVTCAGVTSTGDAGMTAGGGFIPGWSLLTTLSDGSDDSAAAIPDVKSSFSWLKS